MSGTAKNTASGQGSDAAKEKTIDYVVTQADLDANPESVSAGVKVGDIIQVPEASTDSVKIGSTVKTIEEVPAWAADLLVSNQAVIASNTEVLEGIEQFKNAAGQVANEIVKQAKAAVNGDNIAAPAKVFEIDYDAKYIVSKGKKFQDKETGNMITEGMDVTDFDDDRLQNLLSQGTIEAVNTEEGE